MEEILANSESLLDAMNSLTDNLNPSEVLKELGEKHVNTPEYTAPDINLTEALLNYRDSNNKIEVHGMSANDLVKLSQNLTAMLADVNKAIEAVVITRCRSPWR